MSNFDELFNSVENTEMINNLLSDDNFSKLRSGVVEALARDSKIILVTPYDEEKPLDTGMYWYDSAENALYVGAGDFQTMVNVIDFLTHKTSVKYIPAPRINSSVTVVLPNISHDTRYNYITPPKIELHHNTLLPIITHNIVNRKTNLVTLEKVHTVNLPNITHILEVKYEQ